MPQSDCGRTRLPEQALSNPRLSAGPAAPTCLHDFPRIVIVGSSCSGKSTLGRQLADRLGRPHIELDHLYWGPNWTPHADFAQRVEQAAAADAWIADGNYSKVRPILWGRANAILWLNLSFPRVMGRAIWRTSRRLLTQEQLFGGNRESIWRTLFHPDGIPWWVLRTFHRRRREQPRLLLQPEFAHLKLIELRSPADVSALLAGPM